jgi:type IV pilus assembly protein PilQ
MISSLGKRIGFRKRPLFGLVLAAVLLHPSSAALSESTISVKKGPGGKPGLTFNMEFRDADVKDVLRIIGQESGVNIIIAEGVEGKLTLSFQSVRLMEAFNAILKINNLMSLEEGGIIRVFPSPFKEGEGNLVTRMVPINFSQVDESRGTVESLLSKQGAIATDPRTNTLIIRDILENVDRIEAILRTLDKQSPQILIEARIVEASTNFARELGVQWGGGYNKTTSQGTHLVTGPVKDSGGQGGSPQPLTGGQGLSGNNFAVNLPATVGAGLGGGLGFSFGSLNNRVQLDLQLSALEDSGRGRILSNPRILALDNREAKISSGTEIIVPVSTITSSGTTSGGNQGSTGTATTGVTTIDAKLELTVTPHVTSEDLIVLRLRADKKEPDFSREVRDIPPLSTRSAQTDLLVRNGETVVIGGIFTRNESFSQQGIPWLSKIPVLGWLFKRQSRQDLQSELLIFITPTIMEMEEPG